MPGKVLSWGDKHKCFLLVPPEAGILAPVGTKWQCSECGTVWTLVKGKGWQPHV